MSEVTVEIEPTNEPEPSPAIEVNLAEKVGFLEAKCQELESKISEQAYHAHPEIALPDMSSYVSREDLLECENRIVGHVDSVVTMPEPEIEPEIEPTEPEPTETPSADEPPKSRQKRRSFADMYYGK